MEILKVAGACPPFFNRELAGAVLGNGRARRRGVVAVAVAVAVAMAGMALAAARVIRVVMLAAVLDDRADMPLGRGNPLFQTHDAELLRHDSILSHWVIVIDREPDSSLNQDENDESK